MCLHVWMFFFVCGGLPVFRADVDVNKTIEYLRHEDFIVAGHTGMIDGLGFRVHGICEAIPQQ